MKRTAVLTLLSCLILSLAALAGDKAPGVVLIVNGNIGDKSFNDLAHAGLPRPSWASASSWWKTVTTPRNTNPR